MIAKKIFLLLSRAQQSHLSIQNEFTLHLFASKKEKKTFLISIALIHDVHGIIK